MFSFAPNSKVNHLQRVLTPGTQADTGALIHGWAEEVGGRAAESQRAPHSNAQTHVSAVKQAD